MERRFYETHYTAFVEGQNERNAKNRHTERNRSIPDLLSSRKTCPEETICQLGTLDEHASAEDLLNIVTEFIDEFKAKFGDHVHVLDWALHLDESTPHIHERHVFDCENQYGEIAPQQEKALEALGFELPDPAKPLSRRNNRKITFDAACRKMLFEIAKRHGLHATFMPKPKAEVNGSGMHINMSLSRDGRNIFQDAGDENGLSREAYYFIGGILKHIRAITAITNPLVNSYKRLVPGFEAPVYIAWSTANRSPLLRIPAAGSEKTRIELRSPDPAANPYLALAVCLRAGLEGIREKTEPPKSVNCNIFAMTEDEKKLMGIERLPGTLIEAVEELEKDEFIRETLGEHVANKYIEAKKEEWNRYRAQVTDWEINEYLNRF